MVPGQLLGLGTGRRLHVLSPAWHARLLERHGSLLLLLKGLLLLLLEWRRLLLLLVEWLLWLLLLLVRASTVWQLVVWQLLLDTVNMVATLLLMRIGSVLVCHLLSWARVSIVSELWVVSCIEPLAGESSPLHSTFTHA